MDQSHFADSTLPVNILPNTNTNYSLFTVNEPNVTTTGKSEGFLPWDNPWNIISYKTSRQVVETVSFYIFPCIFLVGVSTNVLNCIVFYKQGLKDRMNLCLFWLSLTDLSYLLCETASAAHSFVSLVDPLFAKEYEVKRLSYTTGVTLALLTTSGCISVVIAVERCLCVLFPLRALTLLSTRAMAILLGSITLLLQLGFSLFPLTMKPHGVTSADTGDVHWFLAPAGGPQGKLLFRLFQQVVDVFLQFVVPLLTSVAVFVCTVITILKLKLVLAWRKATVSQHQDSIQEQQTTLTKMLLLISCVYIVCSTPGLMLALWRRMDTEFGPGGKYSNMFFATHVIGYQVFTVSNSSLNFFVYYWRSTRYRTILRALCCAHKAHDAGVSKQGLTLTTQSK